MCASADAEVGRFDLSFFREERKENPSDADADQG
jgi:hypothetical protein